MQIYLPLILLGWLCGALVNYLGDVLPQKRRLVRPFCLQCDQKMSPVNYFLWPRRCTACGYRRGWRTWLVELVYMAALPLIWIYPPVGLNFWMGAVLLVYFGVVVVIDLEYRLIMHPVSIAGAVIGLGVGIYRFGLIKTLAGGAAGFAIMWALYMLGAVIVNWMSRRRGQVTDEVALGFGDVNLSGVLGLMLGWPLILPGLLISVLIGGLVSLVYMLVMLILRRYHLFSAIPYGPFLVAGALILIYFGGVFIQLAGQ